MFGGIPNIDTLAHNLNNGPYLNPDKIYYAVEFDMKREELESYRLRPFADNAVVFNGYCVLPEERTKISEIVVDLIRDEQGNPILNQETGKYMLELRKRSEKEIEKSPDKYMPQGDYLKFITEERQEQGYLHKNHFWNFTRFVFSIGKIGLTDTTKNTATTIKESINRGKNKIKMLDENANTKIQNIIGGKNFLNKKNPYSEKKFTLAVTEFKKQGLTQLDLEEILPEFTNSKDATFLRDKQKQIDKNVIRKHGIHSIKHNDRVAILSLMIAKEEGFIKEESTREREILTYASYYHDIGRVLDVGPHAKRSVRKIKKLGLNYIKGKPFSEEDKRIVQLLVEGHEGKDENIEKLIDKYKIDEKDIEMAKNLLKVLKDADALDRARLTITLPFKGKLTDLNPKYLRLDTSKRLMEASYGLEALSNKVSLEDILNYGNKKPNERYKEKEDKLGYIKVDITKQLDRNKEQPNTKKNVRTEKTNEEQQQEL